MLIGKYLNRFYLKYILFFIFGILALILVDYYQLEIPVICKNIVNGVIDASLFDNASKMLDYMIYLGIIALIMFIGRFTWRYCVLGVAARIEGDLREDMFIHAEKLSNQFYKENKTGALMALFTNDLQMIRQAFGSGTIMLIDAIFLGGFALFRMFRSNWILTCFCLIPLTLMAIVTIIVGRVMEQKFRLRQEAYDKLSDFSQENFSGIAVIKAFVKELNEIRHFDKLNQDNYVKNINYVRYATIINVLLGLVISTIFAVLFGVGAYFVVNDSVFNGVQFKSGELFEFIAYFDTLIWPFMAVAQLINMKAQAKASYHRIEEFLNQRIDIVDKDIVDIDKIKGKIEFRNLTFKYPDGSNNVLQNISFTINSGEMVGIIGKTGCGKTTIVDLLLRTYNIEDNQIFIDDKDIMHLPFKKVRDSIGYVPQDNFLFSDTISNNIGFAFEDINMDEIYKFASLADVHNNIIDFKDKYDTILGERGVTLSGGQKQRVSIARALIKKPSILIFDDSVSAVDTKTEKTILDNLKSIRRGMTTIMIAHRISTVESLDKIILLDDGKVSAIGTHDELLKTSELYREMVHLQSLQEEVEGGQNE